MRVGWIGLGAMGLGMARCAARAGRQVVGHTRGRPEHAALEADGGRLTGDLAAVVQDAEVVCVNLFDDQQVRSVLLEQDLLARLAPGSLLVIHTTSDPALCRSLQAQAPAGVQVVDAAFSGSPAQAAAGELTLMVGGPPAAYARLEPLLASYSAWRRHVGPLGAGMEMKLLNNLMFAAHVRLAADAYRIGESLGFPADTVRDVLARGSGQSRALDILGHSGRPQESIERMRIYLEKDVATLLAIAERAGLDLLGPGALTRELAPRV